MCLCRILCQRMGTVSQVTALAHRGCEDPAGRDGPGLGEQQTLFGGEGAGEWAGTGHLGNRGEEQTLPPPESVMRDRTVKKGWRAPSTPIIFQASPNTATLQASTPWLCISPLPGECSGLTVLWVAREEPSPHSTMWFWKQVPALPPAQPGTVSLSCSEPQLRAVGLVRSLSSTPLPGV